MSERENLFRPIHKGIRSMLYELGSRLQTTDFADEAAAKRILDRLQRDLENSLSNCILCLLNSHSRHEEHEIFSRLAPQDEDAVRLVLQEHLEIARRIHAIVRTSDEVLAAGSTARRIEIGDRLNLEANDLFCYYLQHLNNEEALIVPLMWERFSDDELRDIRATFYDALPELLFEVWLRWTLPSLNLHELVTLFAGLKRTPDRGRYPEWVRLARTILDAPTLQSLDERVGLGTY